MSPMPLTESEHRHMMAVKELGCRICGKPAEFHHIRKYGGKKNHYKGFALCDYHHRAGNYGVAIHAGGVMWASKYSSQHHHLLETYALLDKLGKLEPKARKIWEEMNNVHH